MIGLSAVEALRFNFFFAVIAVPFGWSEVSIWLGGYGKGW